MGLKDTVTKNREIYGNCKVLSPDGHLMFRCEEKKVNWYLSRGLAEIVETDPLTAKLNFEPKGYGNHESEYGLNEMENLCVNCGEEEYLTRHHVVPYCYRKYFPLELKSHNFHDVLAMCPECHDNYERKADVLKSEIAEEYDSPVNGIIDTDNRDIIKLKKLANALLSDNKLPASKVRKIKKELTKEFGWKRITRKRLIEIVEQKISRHKTTHGELVVSKLEDHKGFVKRWRKHFLEYNDCEYLPTNWSVDYD